MTIYEFATELHRGIDTYLSRTLDPDTSAIVARFEAPHGAFMGPGFRPHKLPDGRWGVSLYQAKVCLQKLGVPA